MNNSAEGKTPSGLIETKLGDKFNASAMVSTLPAQDWVFPPDVAVHVALVFIGLCLGVGFILPLWPIQRWADGYEQQKSWGM